MKEEQLKEAFINVKQDIDFLADEIYQLKQEIEEIKQFLENFQTSTLQQINSTHPVTSTQTSTVPREIGGLITPNLDISMRNQGASTDRQTDTSTDTSTHNYTKKPQKSIEFNIQEVSEILESLDNLKKEIRRKFKRVTPQEMAVFSAIYQLEEQNPELSTYKQISIKLGLSESSIRDYVQRLINKGISIKKRKINNKKLILSISSELKKIAPLSTIIKLREI